MEGRKQNDKLNLHSHHLSLPSHDTQDLHTIYKLQLSMKKRLSPQGMQTPSPEGSAELKNMFRRLVEIDTESRDLLMKVFSLLEKDEKLEEYFKKRIKDPKVSKMWELVEQVLACQDELPNLNDDVINTNDDVSKSITDDEEEELSSDRFKIKALNISDAKGVETLVEDGNVGK